MLIPQTLFKDLKEGDWFVAALDGPPTVYRHQGTGRTICYNRYAGIRHGALQLYPQPGDNPLFEATHPVVKIKVEDERD